MDTQTGYHLMGLREKAFVLWIPDTSQRPRLFLGEFKDEKFNELVRVEMKPESSLDKPYLYTVPFESLEVSGRKLEPGIYHYWFEVHDSSQKNWGQILVTDPLAGSVDYRCARWPGNHPASVVKWDGSKLLPSDPEGERGDSNRPTPELKEKAELSELPTNRQLVIYELPTSWSRAGKEGDDPEDRDVGTFQDVLALFDKNESAARFHTLDIVNTGEILADLGINALELLPIADTKSRREWGYATAHYFAADADLGTRAATDRPTTLTDLNKLVEHLHSKHIRLILDTVMAFGYDPYISINYSEFHLRPDSEKRNPDAWQSDRNGELRDGYGGESWRYISSVETYDPSSGKVKTVNPAWVFHCLHLQRWLKDFHADGLRLDSLNNVGNYDFLKKYYEEARKWWDYRYSDAEAAARDDRFLVIGEELAVPRSLIDQKCVDALWNEHFQRRVRAVVLGRSLYSETFEQTVRRMIDCKAPEVGLRKATEAINYITSHDTEGDRNINGDDKVRLYDLLHHHNISDDEKVKRAKLAFACLMTAVGIPMIFAGEEFCDKMDRPMQHPYKQMDPVNYERKSDPWRTIIFDYVKTLVRLRKGSAALGSDQVDFIHMDFEFGRRIIAWVRGEGRTGGELVVVVANFSDAETTNISDYLVKNWPTTPSGMKWQEVVPGSFPSDDQVDQRRLAKVPLQAWEVRIFQRSSQ